MVPGGERMRWLAAAGVLGIALVLWCGGRDPGAAEPEPLAIVGATLWDGTGAPPLPDAVVVTRGGRVGCAGSADACPVPSGARRIDGRGRWLLPGLVDTHVHLVWRGSGEIVQRGQEQRLACGITTIREASTGGMLRRNLRARKASAAADAPAPRIYVSGRVSPEQAAAHRLSAVELVRHLVRRGVDGIKVKGALMDQIGAVVQEAHAAGRPVYGHTGMYGDLISFTPEAVRAGIDGVMHLDDIGLAVAAGTREERRSFLGSLNPRRTRVDSVLLWSLGERAREDGLIDLMLRHGTWLEPTLASVHLAVDPDRFAAFVRDRGLPDDLVEDPGIPVEPRAVPAVQTGLARMRDFVRRFQAAGGTVLAGSDGTFAAGVELHEELALLAESGLPAPAVLAAATRNAARALHWEDRIGTVQPGRLADLVLLDADPLVDVRNTRSVRLVVKGGFVHALPSGPCGSRSPR